MENEFIPYKEAFELKELGFDKPCLATIDKDGVYYLGDIRVNLTTQVYTPLYQQAFRWFRKKYKLNSQIAFCEYGVKSENGWRFTLDNPTGEQFWGNKFSSYEKAELACLKELIEIVKNK